MGEGDILTKLEDLRVLDEIFFFYPNTSLSLKISVCTVKIRLRQFIQIIGLPKSTAASLPGWNMSILMTCYISNMSILMHLLEALILLLMTTWLPPWKNRMKIIHKKGALMARRVSHLLCENEDLRLHSTHISQLGCDGTQSWHGRLR